MIAIDVIDVIYEIVVVMMISMIVRGIVMELFVMMCMYKMC